MVELHTLQASAYSSRHLPTEAKLLRSSVSRWTREEMSKLMVLPWIGPEYPLTRAWVLWHVLEHDPHCSGEMTQTLGLSEPHIKLPPPPPDR